MNLIYTWDYSKLNNIEGFYVLLKYRKILALLALLEGNI